MKPFLAAGIIMMITGCRPGSHGPEMDRPVAYEIGAEEAGHSETEYRDHCAAIESILPAGFTVIVEKPFVVVGDEEPDVVRQRAEKTVQWAVTMLKQDYFTRDPTDIITIWLFKDKESYYRHARSIFNDEPSTPYGYFLESEKALLMNISTGGGTLVHEIVHPFVNANFPGCPPWFNEGLGSLYEQCGEKGGHINAYTNWRLSGLQEAIRAGAVPSFKELMAMNSHQFYTQDKGTNYGQARYLCYYLQEQELLVPYYQTFNKDRLNDPTGYETLKKILAVENMESFQEEWERFVLNLTFP